MSELQRRRQGGSSRGAGRGGGGAENTINEYAGRFA